MRSMRSRCSVGLVVGVAQVNEASALCTLPLTWPHLDRISCRAASRMSSRFTTSYATRSCTSALTASPSALANRALASESDYVYEVIAGTGHMGLIEKPRACIAAMTSFLDERGIAV